MYTRSLSSAVFSHIRTRHAYTHRYTLQIEDSYHSDDHPILTPGESTREDCYISEVKPSEDRENVLGRLVNGYHFVLGLNAIQVHTHTYICENVHGYYSYYHPFTVTASSVGALACVVSGVWTLPL